MDERELIYDWNEAGERWDRPPYRIQFDDETLRDGLQSPSVKSPPIEQKIELLHLMDRLAIDTADIGLPGAGPHVVRDVTLLAQEIVDAKLKIAANCAARTMVRDIEPVVDVVQKTGLPIEVCTFIGSSPIRQYAENWSEETMLQHTRDAVTFAVREGLQVMYVTEDTIRAHPSTLRKLFLTAIECGAKRLCLCDTVGHATPSGVRNLLGFACEVVAESGADVELDWHGHSDRGLAVINTIAAIRAGATRVHGCAIGIGERVGNTPMDQLLVNLRLLGWIENDLTSLTEYCEKASLGTGVPIPVNYPMVGADAFRTGTGVHAAAVIKAYKKGEAWLADRVYSGVPAGMVGRHQEIEVGPMSGESNVVFWLQTRNIEPTPERVQAVFQRAKSVDRVLTDDEVHAVLAALAEAGTA
ncbi:MAG: 2-isopropylmalate synthase [Candidatus Eisenbacteria bacterium]|uniref:2-isopropylmalate synthase n=1 Tax=Eiseniibacteriota bacterium TaxID=2212470 RepID=A0A933SHK7_UNCEI|nr:2-isopropylmalate synthase [Candidatus Eisenbacteria bacterium]